MNYFLSKRFLMVQMLEYRMVCIIVAPSSSIQVRARQYTNTKKKVYSMRCFTHFR